jgi:hypothetical protein
MSKPKSKSPKEEPKEVSLPLAEVLIQVAVDYATKSGMRLGEVMGHFEIGKTQLYQRNIQAMQDAAAQSAPAEGGDKEGEVVSFPAEAEGKAGK